jgi:Zn-dependent protease with chaperone function
MTDDGNRSDNNAGPSIDTAPNGATLPDRVRISFPGISTRAWEHPADRTALVAMRSFAGFDTVLRTLSGLLRERQHRLLYLATAVRVDERQFRTLHQLREDCVRVLDTSVTPEMFVLQDPEVNAFTIGMDVPFIVLTTGLVDLLDVEELRFVIGGRCARSSPPSWSGAASRSCPATAPGCCAGRTSTPRCACT